jgi:5-enolpyruvylshikimate-3-phosphate synthase
VRKRGIERERTEKQDGMYIRDVEVTAPKEQMSSFEDHRGYEGEGRF